MSKQQTPTTTRGKLSTQALDDSSVENHQDAAGPSSGVPSKHIRRQVSSAEECTIDSFGDKKHFPTFFPRKRFSAEEKSTLEEVYQKANRPSSETKQNLAIKIKTTHKRIETWFQNRRVKKQKKISGDGGQSIGEGPSSSHAEEISGAVDDSEPTGRASQTNPSTVNERRKRASKSKKEMIEPEKRRVDHHENSDCQPHSPAQDYSTTCSYRILGTTDSSQLPTFYQRFNPETLQFDPLFISTKHHHANIESYYPDYDFLSKPYYNTVAPPTTVNNRQYAASSFSAYGLPSNPYNPYLPPVVFGQPQASMIGGGGLMPNKANVAISNDSRSDLLAEESTFRQQQ